MRLPKAHFICECCDATCLAKNIRYVGKQWICEECYYDELATKGAYAFKHGPSFRTFKKLSNLIEIKRKICK